MKIKREHLEQVILEETKKLLKEYAGDGEETWFQAEDLVPATGDGPTGMWQAGQKDSTETFINTYATHILTALYFAYDFVAPGMYEEEKIMSDDNFAASKALHTSFRMNPVGEETQKSLSVGIARAIYLAKKKIGADKVLAKIKAAQPFRENFKNTMGGANYQKPNGTEEIAAKNKETVLKAAGILVNFNKEIVKILQFLNSQAEGGKVPDLAGLFNTALGEIKNLAEKQKLAKGTKLAFGGPKSQQSQENPEKIAQHALSGTGERGKVSYGDKFASGTRTSGTASQVTDMPSGVPGMAKLVEKKKITREFLMKIIREELEKTKMEEGFFDMFSRDSSKQKEKVGGMVISKRDLENALRTFPNESNPDFETSKSLLKRLMSIPEKVFMRGNQIYTDNEQRKPVMELPGKVSNMLSRTSAKPIYET